MGKTKYFVGDALGPQQTLFLKRLPNSKGIFKCSFCGKEFQAGLTNVAKGWTKSCGCLHSKQAKINGKKAILNLIGKRFGKLTVIEQTNKRDRNYVVWKCKCDCGNITYANTSALTCDKVHSCGCMKGLDIAGQTFGFLTAIKWTGRSANQGRVWEFKCKCGKTVELAIGTVTSGNTLSCGCSIESKGERKISKLLDILNIKYFKQYKIPINNQRFDFFLPKYNIVIEYDGIQHFEVVEHFGGEKGFKERLKRDEFKNKYCRDNGITMIKIPYTDFKKIDEKYILERIGDVNE